MARNEETGLESFGVSVDIELDARDIVAAVGNSDERILVLIVEMLEAAGSSELREDLMTRLTSWDEEHSA